MANTTFSEYLQNTEDAISSGHIHDAMASCQHILSFFPDALEAQRLLGEVYLAQNQLEEAQQTFDWILVNDPENVVVYCDRALTSERLADIDTALDCYQQAYELSRGNSQIRQKFNQLSAKVGQQDFMFSRAGLARLYMRGDLLTQAEQEWEAVLNTSPERLDARTGLLETWWREGVYDKADQMAKQILEEVPTCLKALLLLAHVTSTFNLEHSKELLLRAEALDPELIMAHELFGDVIASQPDNPFLAMLKKEPIIFSETTDDVQKLKNQITADSITMSNGSHKEIEHVGQMSTPSNLETWSELDTKQNLNIVKPVDEVSPFASWDENSNVQHSDVVTLNDHISQRDTVLDTIKSSPELKDDFDPTTIEQQIWFKAELMQVNASDKVPTQEFPNSLEPSESIHSWSAATQEGAYPTPPAWLDVLTRFDSQPEIPLSKPSHPSQELVGTIEHSITTDSQAESELIAQKMRESELNIPTTDQVTEEPDFFSTENYTEMEWPEWLKSLGAETLEADSESAEATVELPLDRSHEFPSWTEQFEQTLSEAEQEHITVLEQHENDLRSQGFVPLEPGILASFAEEPSLSSALAELGNLPAGPLTPEPPVGQVNAGELVLPTETTEPTSPLTLLAGNPQPHETVPTWENELTQSSEVIANSVTHQHIAESTSILSEIPGQNSVQAGAASQAFEPIDHSDGMKSQESPLISAYHPDTFLEDDLQTTMTRPAIRLQSIHRSTAQPDTLSLLAKGSIGDLSATHNGNVHNKDRLLRGYQLQLAGAYDDAMAEYRIIIRNAPELLSEVISNVRALLKLSPRYSVGYRVLGDAYMRQGEYLQAMEAYNKALTIAKKAKIQSS